MNLLCFDPGSTLTGWATITHGARGRARYIDGGIEVSQYAELGSRIARADAVAIENIEGGVWAKDIGVALAKGRELAATQGVARLIEGTARTLGKTVVIVPAATVRKTIGVGRSPSDGEVRFALSLVVENLPSKPARSVPEGVTVHDRHVHVRDAIAVGVAALMRLPNRRTG